MGSDHPKQPRIEPGQGLTGGDESNRRRDELPPARDLAAAIQLSKDANAKLVVATLRSQEVAEEAQAFRLLVESVKDHAILMLDPHGNVTTWNPGAERIEGYSASEIVGKHFSAFYPPDDVAAGRCQRELRVV